MKMGTITAKEISEITSQSLIHQVSVSDGILRDEKEKEINESQSLIHQVSVSDAGFRNGCGLFTSERSQSLIHQVSVSDFSFLIWEGSIREVSIPYSSGLSFRL